MGVTRFYEILWYWRYSNSGNSCWNIFTTFLMLKSTTLSTKLGRYIVLTIVLSVIFLLETITTAGLLSLSLSLSLFSSIFIGLNHPMYSFDSYYQYNYDRQLKIRFRPRNTFISNRFYEWIWYRPRNMIALNCIYV